jgi:hypothetical protein
MPSQQQVLSVLVLVDYGNRKNPALERLLVSASCLLERVSTDVLPGQVLVDPNEAFEFSGYQEGLARVLSTHGAAPTQPLHVVFANDTLTNGHPISLSYRLLRWLTQLPASATPRFSGLRMPINDGIRALTGEQGYVSTWAFALSGTAGALRGVRFYEDNEVSARFASTLLPDLPPAYLAWQHSWLAPKGLFSGWHKACPGISLDKATRHRKQLAIYLEHRLPQRLAALGFEMVDLGSLLSPVQALCLRALRLLDRLHVNRLKLAHRLPLLLRRTRVQ